MDSHQRHQELMRRTAAELARTVALAEDLKQKAGRPPGPGDVYLLSEGMDEAIEWVVLEQDGERWFAVPADTVPLAGSADVAVPAARPCGPLCLRCGSGLWLDRPPDAGERTGTLAPEDLEQARDRRRAVAAGDTGSVTGREVDGDPEYRQWLEVVSQVRAAVAARRGTATAPAPNRRLPGSLLALAATLLLVTTLALWVRNIRLGDRLEELSRGAAQTNLPVAWLLGDLRSGGRSTKITLPADSAWLMLILRAPEGEAAGARYRLEMRREGSEESFWSQDGLRDLGNGEITLAVPRHLLAGGGYQLILRRPDGDRTVRVYSLEIEIESEPPP